MIQLFNYNGNHITFQVGNSDVMVNATEMAKPFGKRPSKFLELPSTENFIKELQAIRFSDRSKFINTVNGVGTWMHEDVALEFARWLSPAFAIWCNDRIKELMKYGFTATPKKLEELLTNPDLVIELAQQLKTERIENQRLRVEIETNPCNVLQERLISTNEVSRLGSKAIALYTLLINQRKKLECPVFNFSDREVADTLKISRKTARATRIKLQKAGLIDYEITPGNPVEYTLKMAE